MYRKYSGSTKSSRNERLAQLSEQENVIERKKREILAKIEAQKKKETEEALKKLEPTNTYKKENPPASKNNSCNRVRDTENGETQVQTPRNAFSNDGSFLDQFMKLSRSGFPSTTVTTLTKAADKDEESSKVKKEKEEKEENEKPTKNSISRWDYIGHLNNKKKFGHSSDAKLQDFNFPTLLPQPGAVQLVSEQDPALVSNVETGENTTWENSSVSVSTSDSTTQFTQFYKKRQNQETDKSSDSAEYLVESEKKESARKQFWDYNETESEYGTSISLSKTNSLGTDDSTRISPAFTEEAGTSVTSGDYTSSKTIRHGQERLGLPTKDFVDGTKKFLSEESDSATTGNTLNLEDVRNIAYLPKSNDKNTDFKDTNTEKEGKRRYSDCDSSDSDSNSKDSLPSGTRTPDKNQLEKDKSGDGYQADCEDGLSCGKTPDQRHKRILFHTTSIEESSTSKDTSDEFKDNENSEAGDFSTAGERRKRRKKSRWGDEVVSAGASNTGTNLGIQRPTVIPPITSAPLGKTPMLSKLTRSDPGLIQYAKQTFGSTNLSEEDWKKAEDHYKINLLYQDMVKKRAEIDRLEKAGKFKYEYDSDEDVEGGTWEHKLRQQEMLATQLWAEELTRQAAGKHHIGDFLPPEELERFMERYNAVKQGRKPDLSDYKEFKLKEDNVGYRLLQKMGWNEGQGLGQDGSGITNPVNKASTRHENQGLGVERPDGLEAGDDEYDAYRKRMMLAYRFRPNPLNNPRRPYY